jgi:hypothetical protein
MDMDPRLHGGDRLGRMLVHEDVHQPHNYSPIVDREAISPDLSGRAGTPDSTITNQECRACLKQASFDPLWLVRLASNLTYEATRTSHPEPVEGSENVETVWCRLACLVQTCLVVRVGVGRAVRPER